MLRFGEVHKLASVFFGSKRDRNSVSTIKLHMYFGYMNKSGLKVFNRGSNGLKRFSSIAPNLLEINGTHYKRPEKPVVGICLDGTSPDYLEAGKLPKIHGLKNIFSCKKCLFRIAFCPFFLPQRLMQDSCLFGRINLVV